MAEEHRITQEPVEVAVIGSGSDLIRRITQEPIEVAVIGSGSDLVRRITQVVVEVAVPVGLVTAHPFCQVVICG